MGSIPIGRASEIKNLSKSPLAVSNMWPIPGFRQYGFHLIPLIQFDALAGRTRNASLRGGLVIKAGSRVAMARTPNVAQSSTTRSAQLCEQSVASQCMCNAEPSLTPPVPEYCRRGERRAASGGVAAPAH
jgi:hypothetical protein